MAAQFIAEEGPLKGLVLALDEGDEWTIGRDIDQCNLLLEDPMASRRHLLCRKSDRGYVIENLSETHPVLVNGAPLEGLYLLHESDLVKVGATLFRFYLHAPVEAEPIGQAEAKQETIYEEEQEGEEPIHFDLSMSSRFLVKVIAGPNTGAEFALDPGRSYTLGTDSTTCDIVFHDLSVSREHGRIAISEEGELIIEDLDSRNGIIVERERIIGSKRFFPNTVITVGTTSFLVLDREAEAMTIAAPLFEMPPLEEEESAAVKEEVPAEVSVAAKKEEKAPVSRGGLDSISFISGVSNLIWARYCLSLSSIRGRGALNRLYD
jgi:pSer/pThr/pTyr-binding forkhead associated (FHA) protein